MFKFIRAIINRRLHAKGTACVHELYNVTADECAACILEAQVKKHEQQYASVISPGCRYSKSEQFSKK